MDTIVRVDGTLAKEAEKILNEVGIDLRSVVNMTLKRVVRDGNIAFLMPAMVQPVTEPVRNQETNGLGERGNGHVIAKSQAVALFTARGIRFNRNVTFASKNKSAYNYWANPYFSALSQDWYLILNDWIKGELHLFMIPARTIDPAFMVSRVDLKEKIDLQIGYNDPTFTDNRSKHSFAKYLVMSIRY